MMWIIALIIIGIIFSVFVFSLCRISSVSDKEIEMIEKRKSDDENAV